MAVDTCSLFRDERNREPAVEPNLVEIVVELDSDVAERLNLKLIILRQFQRLVYDKIRIFIAAQFLLVIKFIVNSIKTVLRILEFKNFIFFNVFL